MSRASRPPRRRHGPLLLAGLLLAASGCALLRGDPPRPRVFPSGLERRPPRVVSTRTLVEDGRRLDWCAASNRIAFARQSSPTLSEIYSIRPNGRGERCLSCGQPDLAAAATEEERTRGRGRPRLRTYRSAPVWHPSCEFLAIQVGGPRFRGTPFERPPFGIHTELWLLAADGSWAQRVVEAERLGGVMAPVFSDSGDRLLWSAREPTGRKLRGGTLRLYPGSEDPWSGWRLSSARLATPPGGPVELGAPEILLRRERSLVRASAVTGDGIWFSQAARHDRFMDEIFRAGPDGRQRKNLSRSRRTWEEQPQPSPWGTLVAYRSSLPYAWRRPPDRRNMLRLELWALDADGGRFQLTRLNDTDVERRVKVEDFAWGPSGREIAIFTAAYQKGQPPRRAIEILRLDDAY